MPQSQTLCLHYLLRHGRGFHRIARYSAWDGSEFTVTSTNHISVYTRRVG